MEEGPFKYDITIFEREERLGGRIKTIKIPFCNPGYLDVGASHFFASDRSTVDLVARLGLRDYQVLVANSGESAVWNGERIVEMIPDYQISWRAWTYMTLRFGINFIRGLRLAHSITNKIRKMDIAIPFTDIYSTFQALGANSSCWWSPVHYLRHKWIGGNFVETVVRAKIRGMYGQNMINTTSFFYASAIASGPRLTLNTGLRLFVEKMIEVSGATVHLSHTVSQISTRHSKRKADVHATMEGSRLIIDSFDAVVIAAPLVSTDIDLPDFFIQPASVEYADRYVTYFISPSQLNPAVFGLEENSTVPEMILTIPHPNDRASDAEPLKQGIDGFFSLSTNSVSCSEDFEHLYRYRILSSHNFTNEELHQLLKPGVEPKPGDKKQEVITWRTTQRWPYAWPTAEFSGSPYGIELSDNVYLTSNIELVSSGIEAAVVMGQNVARLVVEDLKRQAAQRFAPERDLDE